MGRVFFGALTSVGAFFYFVGENMDNAKKVCFIGNRTINETKELKLKLTETVERLITEEKADTFLFGSKSRFNGLSVETVSALKEKYPHIKRIYVRAEYPEISDEYTEYLLERYEDTYYPESIINANKSVYVERNYEMIKQSDICVIYYDHENAPTTRKSGAKLALDYAKALKKEIILFP